MASDPIFPKEKVRAEREIQKEILNFLKNNSVLHWRQNSGMVPIGGGNRFIRLGAKGLPDICVIMPPHGKFVGLEVKTRVGKVNPNQKDFAMRLTNLGGYYFVVRSLEDAVNALRKVMELELK